MRKIYIVKLILRKDKERKNGTCPIYIDIHLNGKFFVKFSTGEYGIKENWDSLSQSFIGKGYGLLNKQLKQMVYDLENYIAEEKSRMEFVSAEMLKSYFRKEDNQCYYRYFDDTFSKSRLTGLAQATKDKYGLLRRSLKEFRPQLRLCEIDLKFLHDFRDFLVNEKGLGDGGRWNREKNFRATVKLAFDLGMLKRYPFRNFKLNKPKCKNEALNLEELNNIVEVDLSGNKRLEDARDKFLFACYTGLRFGDVKALKWGNINKGLLNIVQEKTKNAVSIPLNKQAKEIIGKNVKSKRERETVFKVVSNQKTNYALKDIAVLAKVDKNVTFHLARHTFGTVLGKTENAYTIAKLMGHKKLATSMIYVNTDENELRDKMKNVNFGL